MNVVVGRRTKPMSDRVDAERAMVSDGQTQSEREAYATQPVVPHKARDNSWENNPKDSQQNKVVTMLPLDKRVMTKIRNVGRTRSKVRLENHPTDMGP